MLRTPISKPDVATSGLELEKKHVGRAGRWGGVVLRKGGMAEGGREVKHQLMNGSR